MEGVSVKIVILAGRPGTRLAEETAVRPKPMVKVGERLKHIMKLIDNLRLEELPAAGE